MSEDAFFLCGSLACLVHAYCALTRLKWERESRMLEAVRAAARAAGAQPFDITVMRRAS